MVSCFLVQIYEYFLNLQAFLQSFLYPDYAFLQFGDNQTFVMGAAEKRKKGIEMKKNILSFFLYFFFYYLCGLKSNH